MNGIFVSCRQASEGDQFWNRLASGLDDLAPEVVAAFLNLLTAGGPVEPRSRRCGGWTVRRR
jgi:hypothetical protein